MLRVGRVSVTIRNCLLLSTVANSKWNAAPGLPFHLGFSVRSATSDDVFTHPLIHHPFYTTRWPPVLEGNSRRQKHSYGKPSMQPTTMQGEGLEVNFLALKPSCSQFEKEKTLP